MSEQSFYDWMNAQKAQAEVEITQSSSKMEEELSKARMKIYGSLLELVNNGIELTYLQRKQVEKQVRCLSCVSSELERTSGVFILATYINSIK